MLRIKPIQHKLYKWMCFHPYSTKTIPGRGFYPEDTVIDYCLRNGLHIDDRIWENLEKRVKRWDECHGIRDTKY